MSLKLPSRITASCAVLALFAAVASCTKQKEDAAPTSTFTGKVLLYDEHGTALTDNSGATVSLYENAAISTQTAADGSFSLSNIPVGSYHLKVEKAALPLNYGTYYSPQKLDASTPVYTIPAPIHLGQISDASYSWALVIEPVKRYIIFRGTRLQASASDTRLLYHRLMFDFSISDVYPNFHSSKYSILVRNNLASGFSDTISYDRLIAQKLSHGLEVGICTDNPMADSGAVLHNPFNAFTTGPQLSPYLIKGYPALHSAGSCINSGYSYVGFRW
ncbi:hypothetical protein KB206_12985 [Microvirga sp. STS02]|uniref:beta-sandwich domain-containing protein n=1 Tax=Hymenobacter negativus TaxID=2795026 RepID=UPI0018DB0245|nr:MULTISPECIES: DUF2012 domain-containing protein [Bacteria]MBH8569801.1 hypothetical protein [Hymenobacter negativus]MBR7209541.1 hypothetical protein [Microvirga sp. STS02]